MVEPAREQLQPLLEDDRAGREQAGGKLLFFGVALALWSVSAVAGTFTEAFNVVYQVAETRSWWKPSSLSLAFGPILALVVIVSVGLMLIGRNWWGHREVGGPRRVLRTLCGGGCAFP